MVWGAQAETMKVKRLKRLIIFTLALPFLYCCDDLSRYGASFKKKKAILRFSLMGVRGTN